MKVDISILGQELSIVSIIFYVGPGVSSIDNRKLVLLLVNTLSY